MLALDQLLVAKPDALHSLGPQAGVDIAEVKRICAHEVCLIGNLDCGLLATDIEEEGVAAARYALKREMPPGGCAFFTSNCIYPGLPSSVRAHARCLV